MKPLIRPWEIEKPPPVMLHASPHPSRAERRHVRQFRFVRGERVNYKIFIPTKYQSPLRNTPYVKPVE